MLVVPKLNLFQFKSFGRFLGKLSFFGAFFVFSVGAVVASISSLSLVFLGRIWS